MWLLLVEALFALMLLVFIVWWTMFSGRAQEPQREDRTATTSSSKHLDEDKNNGENKL